MAVSDGLVVALVSLVSYLAAVSALSSQIEHLRPMGGGETSPWRPPLYSCFISVPVEHLQILFQSGQEVKEPSQALSRFTSQYQVLLLI